MVTEQHHIDYQLVGLEDEGEDGEDDGEGSYAAYEDGELSFDYRHDVRGQNVFSTAKNPMEVSIGQSAFAVVSSF